MLTKVGENPSFVSRKIDLGIGGHDGENARSRETEEHTYAHVREEVEGEREREGEGTSVWREGRQICGGKRKPYRFFKGHVSLARSRYRKVLVHSLVFSIYAAHVKSFVS